MTQQLIRVFIDEGTFCPGFRFLAGGQLHPTAVARLCCWADQGRSRVVGSSAGADQHGMTASFLPAIWPTAYVVTTLPLVRKLEPSRSDLTEQSLFAKGFDPGKMIRTRYVLLRDAVASPLGKIVERWDAV